MSDDELRLRQQAAIAGACKVAYLAEINPGPDDFEGKEQDEIDAMTARAQSYAGKSSVEIAATLNEPGETTPPRICYLWAGIPYAPNVITAETIERYGNA